MSAALHQANTNPDPNNAGTPNPPAAPTPPTTPANDPADELRAELARERADKNRLAIEKKAKEDELEQMRLGKLKEQNDWQKVAQDYEAKYNEEKKAREGLSTAVVTDKKMTAMREAAIKHGILDSALDDLDMLDFPEVKVETTNTGRTSVIGTENAVQRLKGIRPHWFGKQVPNVNGGAPRVTDPEGDQPFDNKKLFEEEAKARKSGDWSGVKKLHELYRAKGK